MVHICIYIYIERQEKIYDQVRWGIVLISSSSFSMPAPHGCHSILICSSFLKGFLPYSLSVSTLTLSMPPLHTYIIKTHIMYFYKDVPVQLAGQLSTYLSIYLWGYVYKYHVVARSFTFFPRGLIWTSSFLGKRLHWASCCIKASVKTKAIIASNMGTYIHTYIYIHVDKLHDTK